MLPFKERFCSYSKNTEWVGEYCVQGWAIEAFSTFCLLEGVWCVQVSGMSVTTTHPAHINWAEIIEHARATHFTTITLAPRNAYVIAGSFEVVPLRDFGFSGGDIKANSTHISCHGHHYPEACPSFKEQQSSRLHAHTSWINASFPHVYNAVLMRSHHWNFSSSCLQRALKLELPTLHLHGSLALIVILRKYILCFQKVTTLHFMEGFMGP